jgi:hypothetical protein
MPARTVPSVPGTDVFIGSSIEVVGIKEALKELNKVDKSLRRQITKDYKSIVQNVIDDISARIPLGYPLRNWKYAWKPKNTDLLPWGVGGQRIYAKINTRAPKRFSYSDEMVNLATFVIKWDDPSAALLEFAQRGVMGQNLTNKFGPTSRIAWPAFEANKADVLEKMQALVDRVTKGTQDAIDRLDAAVGR